MLTNYGVGSICNDRSASRLPTAAPLFHRFAMHSYELLREVFDKKAPKQVAADLGLSLSMIYKWAEPPNHAAGSGTGNPLDRIEALLKSTGDQRLVQWICQRAGGFFILNPKNTPHPHFLIPATNQIVQEFADLLAVIATAAADNQITAAEVQANPRPLGGIENRDGRFCGLLRRGKFWPDPKCTPPNIRRQVDLPDKFWIPIERLKNR